ESSCAVMRDRVRAASEFRMRFEVEVVVNLENDDVDSLLRERLKILTECIELTIGVVIEQMHSAPRFCFNGGNEVKHESQPQKGTKGTFVHLSRKVTQKDKDIEIT